MRKAVYILITLSLVLLMTGLLALPDAVDKSAYAEPEKLAPASCPIISSSSAFDGLFVNTSSSDIYGHSPIFLQKQPFLEYAELIDFENIEENLRVFTEEIGPRQLGSRGNLSARRYIVSELESLGFSESAGTLARQGFYALSTYTENILAVIPSEIENAPILLFGAHFDSVSGTQGAVDNASGATSLLAIIRAIIKSGHKYEFELRFCFFSAEENGYYGAYRYLNLQNNEAISRHTAFINIDMSGYELCDAEKAIVISTKGSPNGSSPAEPNIISFSAESAYQNFYIGEHKLFCPEKIGKHDIVPFYRRSIPCATFSWREIDPPRAVDNNLGIAPPHYMHTRNDNFENIDVGSVYIMTQFIIVTFCSIADHLSVV